MLDPQRVSEPVKRPDDNARVMQPVSPLATEPFEARAPGDQRYGRPRKNGTMPIEVRKTGDVRPNY